MRTSAGLSVRLLVNSSASGTVIDENPYPSAPLTMAATNAMTRNPYIHFSLNPDRDRRKARRAIYRGRSGSGISSKDGVSPADRRRRTRAATGLLSGVRRTTGEAEHQRLPPYHRSGASRPAPRAPRQADSCVAS